MTRHRVSTDRGEVLHVVDRVRDLTVRVENAYEQGHEYAYGKRDGATDEQTEKIKSGSQGSDTTGNIVVSQQHARRLLKRAAGQVVAWEQKGLRVLEVLAEMAGQPDEWERLEGSAAFGPSEQDTTTPEYEYGHLQREKRRVQEELARIATRETTLLTELESHVARLKEIEAHFHREIEAEKRRKRGVPV